LRGAPARADFATTLLAAVVAPPWFVWVSVGDGFLVVDRDPGGVHLVVAPPTDREFQGETTFLTSADRLAALRYDVLLDPLARGLALCTDGLMEGLLTLESNPPLPAAPPEMVAYFDYVRDRTKESAGLERTLASPEFAATSGDDKTIAMVVRL